MVYEWRTYELVPGREEAAHRRFAEHICALFARHGVHVLGYFQQEDDPTRLHYLCSFPSWEARDQAVAAFQNDPAWRQVKAATEVDGPIVARQTVVRLRGTSYSPLQ